MRPLEVDEPTVVGPYRLLGRLGSGGMGRVYLGRSAGGRTVAVKIVHPHFALDEEFRARFRREVEAARRVGAAYTAPVLDADPDASVPWVATGYAAGPTLTAAVADSGALADHSVRVLGAGLAEALSAVHGLGLVHRDVKPSNVLLTLDGPLLIDFGIARATDGTASLTSTGVSIGSPGYMSPEQILGKGVTGAADVFSLGAVLAYAATGSSPFPGDSSAALLYKVVHEEPELGALSGELREAVAGCLAKDPSARPTPGALATALAPEGAARLVAAGWLPGPLVEQVSRSAVRLLNLEATETAPSGVVGFSSPSVGEGTTPDRPAPAPAPIPAPTPGTEPASASGAAPAQTFGTAPGPVPGGAPEAGEAVGGTGGGAGTDSGAGAGAGGGSSPVAGVFGPPDPSYASYSPYANSGPQGPHRPHESPPGAPAHLPEPRDGDGAGAGPTVGAGVGAGKLSVSVAATSAPTANGRGRKLSCTVALAVAGALAAVTFGSVFAFDLLPGTADSNDSSDSGAADSPPAATARPSASLSAETSGLPAVPKSYLGTWEGNAFALDGSLPMGTFRVTVRQAGEGDRVGTFRQTDLIGGTCDTDLVLKKVTERQLVATSVSKPSTTSQCTTGRHEVRLIPAGDDLRYETDNAEAGDPVARMSKVG
ncbi:serine/threonine-protein kinase [Streptomyces sp. Qhu-G9]|uniref:serine/threonine-protein kinase n=1 Tax=Streptomyces sp. Qhu-G9 TaxID=3452799 RepID=UPI0022AC89F9|nr:serine/threonine-protein kinase [Streptomyces aurantiacus]WAU79073.1 serine/threonine-protein kinase [Streptomyces aurantiacus]